MVSNRSSFGTIEKMKKQKSNGIFLDEGVHETTIFRVPASELAQGRHHPQRHDSLQHLRILHGQMDGGFDLGPAVVQIAGGKEHPQKVAAQHHLKLS